MSSKRWYQDWLGWVILASIVYGLICLLSLASDVGRPFPGFFTYYNLIHARMDIEWNIPSWWWDTTGERPRLGDIPIRVNETPFAGISEPVLESTLYQDAWDQDQKTVQITVHRDGRLLTFPVPLELFSWSHYADLMFMPLLVAACYWLLAIILYRADSSTGTQRLIVLILCAMAILAAAVKGSLFIFGGWRETILLFINPLHSITATFIGAMLIHLAFQFPFPRWPRMQRLFLPAVYSLAALLYLFFFLGKIIVWRSGATPLAHWLDEVWFNVFQTLIIVGIIFVLARMLGDAFFLPDKSRERQEARLLLLAFLMFLPTVWFAIHGLSGSNDSILFLQSLADTRLLALVVPFAFATISLRYHTFAGAESWLLLALILAVSGFLANVGTAVLFWQSPQIIRSLPFPPTAVLFLLFLLISLVGSWQSSWRGWLGRVFHWDRVSYREALTYGSHLSAASYANEKQLAQGICEALCDALGVIHAVVWLPESEGLTLTAVAGTIPEKLVSHLRKPAAFPSRPFRLGSTAAAWLQPCYPDMAVILPLTLSHKIIGLIGLGQRWDTAVFDDRDLEILDLIGQQSAIFLQIARQTAQLRQTDQQLLHIQKLTQQKTAQNLHDHLLPALNQLQMKLLTASELLHTQPETAHTLLAESHKALRENVGLVRRIQKDLIMRPLEYGLLPYLSELVNQLKQDTGINATLHLPPGLDETITDTNIREVIYAVWQQAFNNIAQHAQASHVAINLELTAVQLTFSICDNGRGSLPEQQQQALQKGHFGLRSMHIRLQSINGQFTFKSEIGQGSCVIGQIPLPGAKKTGLPHGRPV